MSRLSWQEMATRFRRMAVEKAEHLNKNRKQRPDYWIEMYEGDIRALNAAVMDYEKAAARDSA